MAGEAERDGSPSTQLRRGAVAPPPACLAACVAAAAALLLFQFCQWEVVDLVTPFLFAPVALGAWLPIGAVAPWALVHAAWYWRRGLRAAYPLIVCVAAALAATHLPLSWLWLTMDFYQNRAVRRAIVVQVEQGQLRPNVSYNARLIALGRWTPRVSMGGNEIAVERADEGTYVFFYTFRGVLDHYSGFLCVPRGGDPRQFADLGEPSTEIRRLDERWYYVSHR